MPWRGYNFEDAIVISENVSKMICLLLFILKNSKLKLGILKERRRTYK